MYCRARAARRSLAEPCSAKQAQLQGGYSGINPARKTNQRAPYGLAFRCCTACSCKYCTKGDFLCRSRRGRKIHDRHVWHWTCQPWWAPVTSYTSASGRSVNGSREILRPRRAVCGLPMRKTNQVWPKRPLPGSVFLRVTGINFGHKKTPQGRVSRRNQSLRGFHVLRPDAAYHHSLENASRSQRRRTATCHRWARESLALDTWDNLRRVRAGSRALAGDRRWFAPPRLGRARRTSSADHIGCATGSLTRWQKPQYG